jgi:hypothetical protein
MLKAETWQKMPLAISRECVFKIECSERTGISCALVEDLQYPTTAMSE